MVTNIPVASSLLKQIIILTRVDNPVSTMHIREMLIESKRKLMLLKGNITELNQWVQKQMGRLHAWEQEAVDLLYYLWKAYKAAPDEEFVMYIKDLKSQSNDGRATYTAEDLMVCTKNVEKLQFSFFLISCSQGILNVSWLSWSLLLKIPCLYVSFTAYENFYKLSKMYCHLILTFHFPIFRMSEYRNPTIQHISTCTLISSSISTYMTDLFLVILFT